MSQLFIKLLIAIALSVDSLAVSVSLGTLIKSRKFKQAIIIAIIFSVVQAVFFGLGSFAGDNLKSLFSHYDHWVAFVILSAISFKIILEIFKKSGSNKEPSLVTVWLLMGLAVATSIDAVAVGLGISLFMTHIVQAVFVVGLVTLMVSFTGVIVGEKLSKVWGKKIQLAGAIILFAIGLKILLEHL